MSSEVERLTAQLAAREAECVELRAALGTAMEMVRLWHGMGMDTASEQRAWKLYEENAPEWQSLRKVRDRPVGSVEVLRERLVLAWEAGYLRGCGGCNPTDGPPWDEDDCRNRDAAIARLLEPRSDTPEADKKGAGDA